MPDRQTPHPIPPTIRDQLYMDLQKRDLEGLDNSARFVVRQMVANAYASGFEDGRRDEWNFNEVNRSIARDKETPMPDPTIRRGSRVEHPRYGQGIVLEVIERNALAHIDWDQRDTIYTPFLDTLAVVPDEHAAEVAALRARIAAALAVTERIGYRPAQAALRAALTDEQPAANHSESPDSSPEPEWEYGVRDYRTPVIVIGPDPMREYRLAAYGTRPLVRRRPASDWEDYDDSPEVEGEEQ